MKFIQKYRFNILFYILTLSILFYDFWLFFVLVDRSLSFDYLPAIIFNIATCFILSLIYFLSGKRKGIVFLLLFGLVIYLVSNMLYFRTYYTILPIDSFTMIENLNGLKDSILTSFRITDIYFLLPNLGLLLLYLAVFKKRIIAEPLMLRVKTALVIISLTTLTIGNELYKNRNNVSNLLSKENEFKYDVIEGTSTYGFICCWGWQVSELFGSSKEITSIEKKTVEDWLTNHANETSKYQSQIVEKRNVILLIVESLESFPINKRIEGIEITPNINKLLHSDSCLYASHVVPQVKGGRSSDAQLLINAGLLPLRTGAACFRNPHNNYKTLAKALKAKGYSTQTLLGGNASFWNQGVFNQAMGYDNLISIDQFRYDETFEFGLSDSSFLSQSVEKLALLKQPFMAEMITLSSHAPFEMIDQRIYLKTPKDCPRKLANYLNAIHYVDKCIGAFVNDLQKAGLYKSTMIIITGDHDAFNHSPYLSNSQGKNLFPANSFVPFIVLNAPVSKVYTPTLGQIDLYPTLLDLLGAEEYKWRGLGLSILDPLKPKFAINAQNKTIGELNKKSNKDVKEAENAWNISDIIISKNYFKQSQ